MVAMVMTTMLVNDYDDGNGYDGTNYEDCRLVENGKGCWVPQGKDEALVW